VANVLLIDDDAEMAVVMAAVLETAGHGVLHAANGLIALNVLARLKPDLMILDLRMPVMDGRELLSVLAEMRLEVPVLVISAIDAALPGDAVAFLRKPIEAAALLETVDRYALPGRR
jgi:CheY-like chemotaxis protein